MEIKKIYIKESHCGGVCKDTMLMNILIKDSKLTLKTVKIKSFGYCPLKIRRLRDVIDSRLKK